MANTLVNGTSFLIQGDGVSTTAIIPLGFTPATAVLQAAATSAGVDVSANVSSVIVSGTNLNITFIAPFSSLVTLEVSLTPLQSGATIAGTVTVIPSGAAIFEVSPTGAANTNANPFFNSLTDGTTKVTVIAATAALKTDMSSIAGTATVVASAGIQKVGIVGNGGNSMDAGQNAVSPGNHIIVGGVYNTTPPALTATNTSSLQMNSTGGLFVDVSGNKTTYRASVTALAVAASATDIFTITGSATKLIRVRKLVVSATQTTAGIVDVVLIKRSTANTAGTSVASTVVPLDSANAAGTATVLAYTVNPTVGTAVGPINAAKLGIPTVATAVFDAARWDCEFGDNAGQPVALRGITQVLAVNLNGVTVAGGSFDIYVEWTEE